jgi:PAS domain S-box-containing protein
MPTALNLLLLEDQPSDAELVVHALRRAGFVPEWRRVETEAEYLAALDPALDLILADYALPQFDGLRALELLRTRGLDIPLIIVSGTIGEERAVAALRCGAADYLIKDRLTRLGAAVEHALQQRRLRIEMQRIEAALQNHARLHQTVLSSLTAEVVVLDSTGTIIAVNAAWEQFARTHGDPQLITTGIGANYLDVCRRAADQFHDAEAALVLAGLQAMLAGQQGHFTLEYGCAAPTGDTWFVMHATPLIDRTGIVVVHEDISARKQAEQALRAAEMKYRTLVEHIPAIVYQAALDATSSTLYVNERIEHILGFTRAEWLADPQRWLTQLHPRDLNQVLADVSRAQAGDTPIRSEFRMLTRDGRVVWFGDEAVVVRDADGRPLFLQGIMLDITARKHAEAQVHQLNAELEQRVADRTADLARANAKLQAEIAERTLLEQQIQRHALHSNALADASRVLAEAGHALPALFETITRHVAHVIGDTCILAILSDDQQSMQVMAIGHADAEASALIRALFPTPYPAHQGLAGQVVRSEQAMLLPIVPPAQICAQIMPEYQPYLDHFDMTSLLIVPLRARGRLLGTLSVSRDRPGRRYIADDQSFLQNLADRAGLAIENAYLFAAEQRSRADAERANRAKSEFLSSMSHELRTPLNAIIGFTGTLLMRLPGPLNANQEQQLTTVQRSSKHLLALINDLLDLARIESGKVELNLVPVVCQAVIEEVAGSLRPLAAQKGLAFTVVAPAAPIMVQSDHRALGQILMNLVNNAIKFTDIGEVRVELARETLTTDDRRPTADNQELGSVVGRWSSVVIRVSDTGIGIAAEDQTKLFTEFGRVESDAVRAREGTGLGLRLSRQLAALLGGTIALSSALGVGSTFTLVLPEA